MKKILIILGLGGVVFFLLYKKAVAQELQNTDGATSSNITLAGIASIGKKIIAGAKKIFSSIGIGSAAAGAGAISAGALSISGTIVTSAGSLGVPIGYGAVGAGITYAPVGAGASVGVGSGGVSAGGVSVLGNAFLTAGLLAAPFTLGPLIANLLGGKTLEEWEAQMKLADAEFAEFKARGEEAMKVVALYESMKKEMAAKFSPNTLPTQTSIDQILG